LGILWPHSNSTIFNAAGTRAAAAKLYFFESGTFTPRTTYSDAALTTPRTHPVICDGYGRAPAIFLDYDDYRERVQTSGGVTIWDTDGIPNATPLTDAAVVDANALVQTGQFLFELIDGTRAGFVRANGRTIGSAASVATERANVDSLPLYTYLYNALSNSVCPVSGGRGANAATDFAANKTLTLPDMRGSLPCGLDTMGNSAASRFDASVPFSVGNATTAGSTAGQNHHTLTTAQSAAHTHTYSSTTGAESAHTHTFSGTSANNSAFTMSGTTAGPSVDHSHTLNTSTLGVHDGGGTAYNAKISGGADTTGGASVGHSHTVTVSQDSAHTHTYSGTTAAGSSHTHTFTSDANGSGTAHNNVARDLLGTWYIKL
jgi:hypothetical protein